MVPTQLGLFYPCFDVPYNELVHTFHLARGDSGAAPAAERNLLQLDSTSTSSLFHSTSTFGGGGGSGRHTKFKAFGKSADRASLASYIRLFEPMVIRALKHYTLTSDVEQQSQVPCVP